MNPLLCTDTYKLGHMLQYPPGTEYVYSYLEARKQGGKVVFFGLQYYLKEYLSARITKEMVGELISVYEEMLGPCNEDTKTKLYELSALGFWPVEIKAVAEGSLIDTQNALFTITNTLPGFGWCVGFLESLLLKVWYPITVATKSLKYKELVKKYSSQTCEGWDGIDYQVHDFGYRGVSSEESAAIAGAAHLLNFVGSDTVVANAFIRKYYTPAERATVVSASVPASEHSVMCSYGQDDEIEAFKHILKTYPTGIVSIVSDTYNIWNVLTKMMDDGLERLIIQREGKVVFRPDSGNPAEILCGTWFGGPKGPQTPEEKGVFRLLWERFGGSETPEGYKVLFDKVGVIYGDGMTYSVFEEILTRMKMCGFASCNLVIGVGGILLQNHSRDEYGFAIKATQITRNGKRMNIYKDPITDPGKRSKRGLMKLTQVDGKFVTYDGLTENEEKDGLLKPVYRDGEVLKSFTIEEVRYNLNTFTKMGDHT